MLLHNPQRCSSWVLNCLNMRQSVLDIELLYTYGTCLIDEMANPWKHLDGRPTHTPNNGNKNKPKWLSFKRKELSRRDLIFNGNTMITMFVLSDHIRSIPTRILCSLIFDKFPRSLLLSRKTFTVCHEYYIIGMIRSVLSCEYFWVTASIRTR